MADVGRQIHTNMELKKYLPKTKAKQKKAISIDNKFKKNAEKIKELLNENINLRYEKNLLYADKIIEDEINIGTKKKPELKKVTKKVWKEGFTDEDTQEVVYIDRQEIVAVDGIKSDGWRELKYYTLDDIS